MTPTLPIVLSLVSVLAASCGILWVATRWRWEEQREIHERQLAQIDRARVEFDRIATRAEELQVEARALQERIAAGFTALQPTATAVELALADAERIQSQMLQKHGNHVQRRDRQPMAAYPTRTAPPKKELTAAQKEALWATSPREDDFDLGDYVHPGWRAIGYYIHPGWVAGFRRVLAAARWMIARAWIGAWLNTAVLTVLVLTDTISPLGFIAGQSLIALAYGSLRMVDR